MDWQIKKAQCLGSKMKDISVGGRTVSQLVECLSKMLRTLGSTHGTVCTRYGRAGLLFQHSDSGGRRIRSLRSFLAEA